MHKFIFDQAVDGMIIVENGKIIDCNHTALSQLGYKEKKELLNKPYITLSPLYQQNAEFSSHLDQQYLESVRAKGKHTFTWTYQKPDGKTFVTDVTLTILPHDHDMLLLYLFKDTHDREVGLKREIDYQKMIIDSVLDSSVDLIFYKDYTNANGKYLGCNKAFCKFLGKTKEQIIGNDDIALFGSEIGEFFRIKDQEVIKKQANISNEEWVTYPDGEQVLLHTTKSLLKNSNEQIIGVLGISRDMTTAYKYKVSLEKNMNIQKQLAEIDPLTSIYNRRSFFNIAEKHLKHYRYTDEPFSLMLIDIDFFKKVNDKYGHIIGDDILKYIAVEVKGTLREEDIFARYGGEEFIILSPDIDMKTSGKLAEQILQIFRTKGFYDSELNMEIPFTASIGVCQYSNEVSIRQLIQKADIALYNAKKNGRDRVELFHE